jgi:hypothetical protein
VIGLNEDHAPARPSHPSELGHRLDRVGDGHQDALSGHGIEPVALETRARSCAVEELDMCGGPFEAGACLLEHRGAGVEPDDGAGWPDELGDLAQRDPGAAADVEDGRAGLYAEQLVRAEPWCGDRGCCGVEVGRRGRAGLGRVDVLPVIGCESVGHDCLDSRS